MSDQKPSPEILFDAALEIKGAEERRAYLDRACGGDAALRQEVESLLTLVVFDGQAAKSSSTVLSRRFLSLVLLVLLALVLLPPLFLGCYYGVALERYKAQLRAVGHFRTLAEARPRPLTNVVSGGPALTNLLRQLPSVPAAIRFFGGIRLAAGTRRVDWIQPELPSEERTNLWPELRVFLGTNAPGIAALREALEAPVLEFAVRYEDGFRVRLPHIGIGSSTVELLRLDALLQLHEGRPALALADTIAGVRLAARWNREPILTTQLIRIPIAMIMSANTWQVLQFQGWSDADLASLQEAWLELDLPAIGDATLDFEAAETMDLLQHLSRKDYETFSASLSGSVDVDPDSFVGVLKLCWRDPKEGVKVAWDRYPRWWAFRIWRHYQVEKVVLQQIEMFRTSVHVAQEQGAWLSPLHEAEANAMRLDDLVPWLPDFVGYSGLSIYPKLMAKYAGIEVQRSLVLAAIALERYRHKHGRYPASLEQLVPEFLAALPHDPMNGQSLHYGRNEDGTFTLYSVGWNGQDDGGNPTPVGTSSSWENGKDIVWPKPANQAEVDAGHEALVKQLLAQQGASPLPGISKEELERFDMHDESRFPRPNKTNVSASPASR